IELGALLGVTLAAIVACVVHVTLRLPELRWPRADAGPGPWPLSLFGAPALLVWPLLAWRERRATERELGDSRAHEVELGFRQLLAIPRIAATSFAVWLGVATILALSLDRKSTRLNSSHVKISYAVFCLKKKR